MDKQLSYNVIFIGSVNEKFTEYSLSLLSLGSKLKVIVNNFNNLRTTGTIFDNQY